MRFASDGASTSLPTATIRPLSKSTSPPRITSPLTVYTSPPARRIGASCGLPGTTFEARASVAVQTIHTDEATTTSSFLAHIRVLPVCLNPAISDVRPHPNPLPAGKGEAELPPQQQHAAL